MKSPSFSASGNSFSIHEWWGSGPARLHLHHSDDEAWHVLDGELTFRYAGRRKPSGRGRPYLYPQVWRTPTVTGPGAHYLIILTPRLSALVAALQADRDPTHQHEIYGRFGSELLE